MIENHKGIAFVKMDFSGMIAVQQQLGQPVRTGSVSGAPIVA
jgi:hypothetical protein